MKKKTKPCSSESQCDLTKLLKEKTELLQQVEKLTDENLRLQSQISLYIAEIKAKDSLLTLTKDAVNEQYEMQKAVTEGCKTELQTIKEASLFKLISMRFKGVI